MKEQLNNCNFSLYKRSYRRYPIILFTILFLCSKSTISQNSDLQAALYNVGLGSIISISGALINKNKSDNWKKVVWRSGVKGAVGGLVVFGSKSILRSYSRTSAWNQAWGSKIINSIGISIIENASFNRGVMDVVHMDIGFLRLQFNLKGNQFFQPRILPFSLLSTTYMTIVADFQFDKTLNSGVLTYSFGNDSPFYEKVNLGGITIFNVIAMHKSEFDSYNNNHLYTHELVHTYQYADFNGTVGFFKNYSNSISNSNKTVNFLSKYVYVDINGPIMLGLYYLGFKPLFEQEADYFSSY